MGSDGLGSKWDVLGRSIRRSRVGKQETSSSASMMLPLSDRMRLVDLVTGESRILVKRNSYQCIRRNNQLECKILLTSKVCAQDNTYP